MALRRHSRYSKIPSDLPPLVHLWLLRLLVPLGVHRDFFVGDSFNNDTLAEALGLGDWIDLAPREFDA